MPKQAVAPKSSGAQLQTVSATSDLLYCRTNTNKFLAPRTVNLPLQKPNPTFSSVSPPHSSPTTSWPRTRRVHCLTLPRPPHPNPRRKHYLDVWPEKKKVDSAAFIKKRVPPSCFRGDTYWSIPSPPPQQIHPNPNVATFAVSRGICLRWFHLCSCILWQWSEVPILWAKYPNSTPLYLDSSLLDLCYSFFVALAPPSAFGTYLFYRWWDSLLGRYFAKTGPFWV